MLESDNNSITPEAYDFLIDHHSKIRKYTYHIALQRASARFKPGEHVTIDVEDVEFADHCVTQALVELIKTLET